MDDKKELLTYIIENRIFGSSWSALAKCLGYKGRMAFSRLKEGNMKLSTVENIINDICIHFNMPYSELVDVTEMIKKGKILYDIIKDEDIATDCNSQADRILADLVTLNFQNFSDDFNMYIVPHLNELYRDDPYVYFGVVMFLYVKMLKINPYEGNIGKFHNSLKKHTSHICSVLKEHIPENAIGHATTLAYLSDSIIRNAPQCIWGLMVYNIHILRYFADPDYVNQILELGVAFTEWGDFSYWHETDVSYSERVRLWTLFFRESSSPLHGMYMGQTFEAGKDNETFIPKENFSLIFWNKESDDDEYATIQACNFVNSESEEYKVYYGTYIYDDENEEITIKWNDEKENFLNIPSRLKRITKEKPAERDEQVWWNIIRRFDDNDSLKIFTETLLNRLNTEYPDDDYDIQDVTISRKLFTLTIKTTDGIKEYSIPIDAYPFLRNLRVFDEVTIKKDTRTEELFVSWPWAGYDIPLREFNTKISSAIAEQ